jgi:hypothetical protein
LPTAPISLSGQLLLSANALRKEVAVARKLAVIHRMRIDGTKFKWSSKEEAAQSA